MTKENYKKEIQKYKGQVLDQQLINKLAAIAENEVFDYMYSTGMELWSAGASLRLIAARGDKDWAVCEYDDPLHPKKEYSSLKRALTYMEDNDQ